MDFYEILYLSIFGKFVEKIQVPFKSDKNNGHFTWRTMYEGWNFNSGNYLFTTDTK